MSRCTAHRENASERFDAILHVGEPSTSPCRRGVESSSIVLDVDLEAAIRLGRAAGRIVARSPSAYFCTFCSASRTQKYTAASSFLG